MGSLRITNRAALLGWADRSVKSVESAGARLSDYAAPLMWREQPFGMEGSLTYEEGKLTQAVLPRAGLDVTPNAVLAQGVERQLEDFASGFSGTVLVRFSLVRSRRDLMQTNERPADCVCRLLTLQDRGEAAVCRHLAAQAYAVVDGDHDTLREELLWLESAGLRTSVWGGPRSPQDVWTLYNQMRHDLWGVGVVAAEGVLVCFNEKRVRAFGPGQVLLPYESHDEHDQD